jgi:endonuclease-3
VTDAERAWAVYGALADRYGEPVFSPISDPTEAPIAVLVGTILSANTNDVNSGRAFDALFALAGGDWETVRTMPVDQIKEAIRPAGMYNQKAPNIVATLERVKGDLGSYDLGGLADQPIEDSLAWLTSLPGVGHKTASIVLLFCFNLASFPVDTHIQRISQRVGIADAKASPEAIKRRWEALIPGRTFYALHLNLIRLGREICGARSPRCERCPLQRDCDYALRRGAWGAGK